LRPYLAIESKARPANVSGTLEELVPFKHGARVAVIAALDGSPEFSRHWYSLRARGVNGRPPELRAEAKDRRFYEFCSERFRTTGAHVLETTRQRDANGVCDHSRPYQDACLATIATEERRREALIAAFRLRTGLATHNEACRLPWDDQLHARIAIGQSWAEAVLCLAHACRGDIVVSPSFAMTFESEAERRLLVAADVNVGPIQGDAGAT
jgi:hypothetical protein